MTSYYKVIENINLGSMGGYLQIGAILKPFEGDSPYQRNVLLITIEDWINGPDNGPLPIFGGWPEEYNKKVEEFQFSYQEFYDNRNR